jgi:hypothetical protein
VKPHAVEDEVLWPIRAIETFDRLIWIAADSQAEALAAARREDTPYHDLIEDDTSLEFCYVEFETDEYGILADRSERHGPLRGCTECGNTEPGIDSYTGIFHRSTCSLLVHRVKVEKLMTNPRIHGGEPTWRAQCYTQTCPTLRMGGQPRRTQALALFDLDEHVRGHLFEYAFGWERPVPVGAGG